MSDSDVRLAYSGTNRLKPTPSAIEEASPKKIEAVSVQRYALNKGINRRIVLASVI